MNDKELAIKLSKASVSESDSHLLTERERAFCDYAMKLTIAPGQMEKNDLEQLRKVGLSDAGILDLNQVVSYFAYANRIVNGLGIEIAGEILGLHPSADEEGYSHS